MFTLQMQDICKEKEITGRLSPFCNKGSGHCSLAMAPNISHGSGGHKAGAPGSRRPSTVPGKQRTHLAPKPSNSTCSS